MPLTYIRIANIVRSARQFEGGGWAAEGDRPIFAVTLGVVGENRASPRERLTVTYRGEFCRGIAAMDPNQTQPPAPQPVTAELIGPPRAVIYAGRSRPLRT